MNKELRKMKNSVNYYVVLFANHPEKFKEDYDYFSGVIEMLQSDLKTYLDKTLDIFLIWCIESVEIFSSSSSNIFLKLKRSINMAISNYYLNKYSYDILVISILQKNLNIISKRLEQIKYFT